MHRVKQEGDSTGEGHRGRGSCFLNLLHWERSVFAFCTCSWGLCTIAKRCVKRKEKEVMSDSLASHSKSFEVPSSS
jgi:hypothetical protein